MEGETVWSRWFAASCPTSDSDGDAFVTRMNGMWAVTPMLLALVAIGFTDLLSSRWTPTGDLRADRRSPTSSAPPTRPLMGLRQLALPRSAG